jgi:uncharacterized protein (DUF3820 family)
MDGVSRDTNVTQIRDYKEYIDALDIQYQVDVDEIVNMMEDIPIVCLREGCKLYTNYTYATYIEMIACWLGHTSNKNPLVYKTLLEWITHIRNDYYSDDRLTFGKYKNIPLCDLPQYYLKWVLDEGIVKDNDLEIKLLELHAMDKQFLHQCFKTPNKIVHLKRCRDSYYRDNWDVRTYSDRMHVLESILQRPWIKLIDEVKPDTNGFVHTHDYEWFYELPFSECDPDKQQDMDSDDDNAYIFTYRPVFANDKYIAICQEDLLFWYGALDEYFRSKYSKTNKQFAGGYAIQDI